jgi:hypothetical protein
MMDWILFIRIIIFITFLLLVGEGIGLIFYIKWFYRHYVTKHQELEVELASVKRRVAALEGLRT